MQARIILPGEVGSQLEPALTVEGLRNLIQDLRRHNQRIPKVILVSEYDRRNVNQDILGASACEVVKEDQRPEHDFDAIGFIEGVVIRSHPDVPRGNARFIYPPVVEQAKPLPSGKIISLGANFEAPKTIVLASG